MKNYSICLKQRGIQKSVLAKAVYLDSSLQVTGVGFGRSMRWATAHRCVAGHLKRSGMLQIESPIVTVLRVPHILQKGRTVEA